MADAHYGEPGFGELRRCPACGVTADRTVHAAELDRRAADARERLRDELGALGHCTFETFDVVRPVAQSFEWGGQSLGAASQLHQLRTALLATRAYARTPAGWLYIHGGYGAGKSHLAAAIAQSLLADGYRVIYRSVPGLLDDLRAGYKRGNYDSLMEQTISTGALFLDDLGAEYLTSNAETILFRILNERQDRPTVITSNVHPDDLPGRIASRIAGNARGVWMPVSDYRRLKGRGGV